MAMLNNQRVYIYIYISWYNQYVQRNLPLLAVFFFSTVHRVIVPLSHYPLRELEENQRNCMDLHDGVLFRTWFSPYVPHVVSCLLPEKNAAGNVQIASRLSSPCWKEQRSLRAMSGSLGVGKLEPHPMVGSRKQHENMSCILGIRDIVEIWWICWHIEMMLLYVVVFLHFAVYKLCNAWTCDILSGLLHFFAHKMNSTYFPSEKQRDRLCMHFNDMDDEHRTIASFPADAPEASSFQPIL